jgi:dTDP-glucose 4,6-dehydratase
MNVLVAGGAGFIGSHLVDAMVARGHRVTVLDNFVTGRASNVAHLHDHPAVTVVEHDITHPLPHAVTAGSFDLVCHLASPASPVDFATLPLEILDAGSTGTRRLLDLATQHRARFFLASTSEVYGDPLVHPQPESYHGNVDPIGPRSCYDEAKRFSEALTMAYHRRHGVDVRIVRIFNTYGERMRPDDGRVVTNFVAQALRGEPLTLYGNGLQTRSFCHVADQVSGQLAVIDGSIGTPVNVGNPHEITMRELADAVIALTGSSSDIVEVPLPAERRGDPMQRCPDITTIAECLGWSPTVSLADGLARMVGHFREHERI